MEIRRATLSDQPAIVVLLKESGHPASSAIEHIDRFIVAIAGERLVGAAQLEVHGSAALLHLVAVERGARGLGVASDLCHALVDHARSRGLSDLYLRTDGAPGYFERLGFRRVCRTRVDARIVASPAFESCASRRAVTMHASVGRPATFDEPFPCTRDRDPACDCPCEPALHDRGRPHGHW